MINWITSKLSALLAIGLLSALALAGVQTVRLSSAETKYAQLETKHALTLATQETQHAADEKAAREKDQRIADKFRTNREDDDKILKSLNTRLAAALDSLRNRPERPAQVAGVVPTTTCDATCGTGAGLYRPDASFLVWLSADAATRAAERDACYRNYSDATKELNSETGSKP